MNRILRKLQELNHKKLSSETSLFVFMLFVALVLGVVMNSAYRYNIQQEQACSYGYCNNGFTATNVPANFTDPLLDQNAVVIVQIPGYIDQSFTSSIPANFTSKEYPNIKGIILYGLSGGGTEIDTMHAIEALNSSGFPIISYIDSCYSGCFLLTELLSERILIDSYGSFGFGHNQTNAWGTSNNLPQEWNSSFYMITGWVSQARHLSWNETYETLPNFYVGQDAVRAGYADQTVENFTGVETYAQSIWGSNVNFVYLPENIGISITIG